MAALAEHGIAPIDMVVVNLYRFEKRRGQGRCALLEELIENIDIGGPTMIRAAAKNYQDVAVVVSPADYDGARSRNCAAAALSRPRRKWRLAQKAFRTTAAYDAPSARAWPQARRGSCRSAAG